MSRSIAGGAGGAASGGERNSRNCARSAAYASTVWGEAPVRTSSCRYRSIWRASSEAGSDVDMQVLIQRFQRAAADLGVARLLVVPQPLIRFGIELRQQIESNVGRLVAIGVGAGDIAAERAHRSGGSQRPGLASGGERGGMHPGHQAGRDGLHVTLHARNLTGEKHVRPRAQLQRWREERRRVDVRVAMDLAVAQELGALEAGNHAEDARLLAELQVVLKADQIEAVGAQVFLPQLHRGPGSPSGARVDEPHRLHGTETERIAPAPRQLFDRQAGFEKGRAALLEVGSHTFRSRQLLHEALVLLAI